MQLEEWLAITGWITTAELAAFAGVHESTVSRKLNGRKATRTRPRVPGWMEEDLVRSRRVGRTLPPADRLLATSKMLGRIYPKMHTHRGPRNFHDGGDHHPLLSEIAHQHPGYFNGRDGAAYLFERVELAEAFYPLAPVLFRNEGAAWSPTGNPLRILSWRWVKNARLIEAVATYEENVRIAFCWVGQEFTAGMLRWRWENQVGREKEGLLATVSSGELLERQRDYRVDPPYPGLDFEPHFSGYVICGADEDAVSIAMEVLPRQNFLRPNAYMFAVGPAGRTDSLRMYTGGAVPADDDAADAFRDVRLDFPENLCPDPNQEEEQDAEVMSP